MNCTHPKVRLYQHGTQAICPQCDMRNNRINHRLDGSWEPVGEWFVPKKRKEVRWTSREARKLRVAHG